jgi:hypothetical protein
MSDAVSDMMKPSYWEKFFQVNKDKIKNDKKIVELIEEYEILISLNGYNEERDGKSLKEKIMDYLYKLSNEREYHLMFKEYWRFPQDWILTNSIK